MNKLQLTKFMLVMVIGTMLVLTACGKSTSTGKETSTEDQNQNAVEEGSKQGEWPEVLRVGFIPDEDQETLSRRTEGMMKDMEKALGIKVEMFVGTDYTASIEAMRGKKLDIAQFGPFAYTIASERSGAVAFAVGANSEKDVFYKSKIIVPADSKVEKLEDLKGSKMLFVDPASASGNLFPRTLLINKLGLQKEEVESYFSSVSFSGSHDASVLAIKNGDADVAAVASTILNRMIGEGLVKESDFKVIDESDPIPGTLFSYRNDLPADLVEKIQQFFYSYQNAAFFEDQKIKGFFSIKDENYQIVRDTANKLKMGTDELLK